MLVRGLNCKKLMLFFSLCIISQWNRILGTFLAMHANPQFRTSILHYHKNTKKEETLNSSISFFLVIIFMILEDAFIRYPNTNRKILSSTFICSIVKDLNRKVATLRGCLNWGRGCFDLFYMWVLSYIENLSYNRKLLWKSYWDFGIIQIIIFSVSCFIF